MIDKIFIIEKITIFDKTQYNGLMKNKKQQFNNIL